MSISAQVAIYPLRRSNVVEIDPRGDEGVSEGIGERPGRICQGRVPRDRRMEQGTPDTHETGIRRRSASPGEARPRGGPQEGTWTLSGSSWF
jgi:hypothetical protein